MATPCPRAADGQHEPLKKAFMCQGCDRLSDCAATLQQAPCPSPIPTPPAPEIKAMTKASPPVSLEPPEKRARTLEALKDAEMKLAHLVMLKGLENERLKLQQLLAAKHQAKSGENGSEAAIKICMHAFASFETRSIYIYILPATQVWTTSKHSPWWLQKQKRTLQLSHPLPPHSRTKALFSTPCQSWKMARSLPVARLGSQGYKSKT